MHYSTSKVGVLSYTADKSIDNIFQDASENSIILFFESKLTVKKA